MSTRVTVRGRFFQRRSLVIVGMVRLVSVVATAVVLILIAPVMMDVVGVTEQNSQTLNVAPHLLVGASAAAVIAAISAGLEIAWGGRLARQHERRIRADLLAHALSQADRGTLAQYPPSRLVNLATTSVEKFTEFHDTYLGPTVVALATPFLVLAYVSIAIDPVIGFSVMGLFVVIPLALSVFSKVTKKASAASRRQRERLSGRYLDAIRAMSTIRLAGAGPRIEADLARHGEENRRAVMRMLAQNQVIIIIVDGLFSVLMVCATVALVGARADTITSAQALTVTLLTILLLEPVSQVAGFFYVGMAGIAAKKALSTYLKATASPGLSADYPTTRENPAIPPEPEHASSSHDNPTVPPQPTTAKPLIDVRHLSFDYGRGPVFSDVNLTVNAGERIALIGPSGAGKTTLANVLRGALHVPEHQGTVNVAEVGRGVRTGDLRQRVASVRQSTWMFTGTIADNLRMARHEATDEAMWQALEDAHVAADVQAMPHGLDTYLGENSALISAGQAQRISLARAFLSDRRILVLDEPTSQVDIESEQQIVEVIAALERTWTVIMVTHREALVDLADRVFRVQGGDVRQISVHEHPQPGGSSVSSTVAWPQHLGRGEQL